MSSDSSHSINQFSQVEVQQLYAAFKSIDSARDGAFTAEQLVHARPELQDNPLCQRILSVFDADRDGAVTFLELASGLARVAGDEETKLRFMFDMYDMDCDGYVSNGDLFKVVALMSGENLTAMQLQQLVDRTIRDNDADGDGMLSFPEFKLAVKNVNLTQQLTVDFNGPVNHC